MQVQLQYLSFAEYVEFEKNSPIRHEYVGGQVFAMTGSSQEHNLIAGNIHARLHPHLRGSSCRVFMSDMKVRIEAANTGYYPDVMVVCDPQDRDRYVKTSPTLIVEVLSPSTESTDRREKLLNYQKLPSLQEYILVSQEEIKIEIYRKDPQGNWTLETLGKDDQLRFESVGLTVTLAEIYEDVFTV
ncbi:MAG: Uma2 family endonuclease [Oscillatoria princeps RMCB-10]|jgi:Uma2 family endonuclease|nr:Uma2 family endonuclease [Oscillatoria princeps RMCB-10]